MNNDINVKIVGLHGKLEGIRSELAEIGMSEKVASKGSLSRRDRALISTIILTTYLISRTMWRLEQIIDTTEER